MRREERGERKSIAKIEQTMSSTALNLAPWVGITILSQVLYVVRITVRTMQPSQHRTPRLILSLRHILVPSFKHCKAVVARRARLNTEQYLSLNNSFVKSGLQRLHCSNLKGICYPLVGPVGNGSGAG